MTNAQLQIALEIATLAHKNVTRRNGTLTYSTYSVWLTTPNSLRQIIQDICNDFRHLN